MNFNCTNEMRKGPTHIPEFNKGTTLKFNDLQSVYHSTHMDKTPLLTAQTSYSQTHETIACLIRTVLTCRSSALANTSLIHLLPFENAEHNIHPLLFENNEDSICFLLFENAEDSAELV